MSWHLKEALSYYKTLGAPQEQSVLLSLLHEVQDHYDGAIPVQVVTKIAHKYELKESYLLALISRFSNLHLQNSQCLEICGSKKCKRSMDLQKFVEQNYGADPNISIKVTGCMHSCGTGPNIRWNGKLYSQVTEESLCQLINNR